ncbi:MAG: FG-GAP repeat domain-containing protein [Candidatus Krumholzibacteriia bacterium]
MSSVPVGGQQVDLNGDGLLDHIGMDVVEENYENRMRLVAHIAEGQGRFRTEVYPTPYLDPGGGFVSDIVLMRDLTGDGKPEVLFDIRRVTGGCFWGPFVLMVNDGEGGFPTGHLLRTLYLLDDIQVVDLGTDGHLDLIISTVDDSGCEFERHGLVYAIKNNGDGTFEEPVAYPPGSSTSYGPVAVGDLSGDGVPDLILPTQHMYLPGIAEAVFGFPKSLPATEEASWAHAVDVDGDEKVDLVLGNASTLTVLRNDGAGNFTQTTREVSADGMARTADFDGSGAPDFVVCDATSCTMLVNDGSGEFAGQMFGSMGTDGTLEVGDVDSDGYPDVLTSTGAGLHMLFSEGNGSFERRTFLGSVTGPVTRLDFDGDGRLDYGLFSGVSIQLVLHKGPRLFDVLKLAVGGAPLFTDFENDGWIDILLRAGDEFRAVANRGDGEIVAGPLYVGNVLRAEDQDQDGLVDVVTAPRPYLHYVLAGRGSGVFSAPRPAFLGGEALAIADIDRDGDDEVIWDNGGKPAVSDVVVADELTHKPGAPVGAGVPSPRHTAPTLGATWESSDTANAHFAAYPRAELLGAAVADFNQDALEDVVTISRDRVEVYSHRGSLPPYSGAQLISDQLRPGLVVAADFDGDGRPDILTDGWLDFYVLFRNTVMNPFGDPLFLDLGGSDEIVVADFDGDSRQDLALALSDGVEVALANGDGTFSRRRILDTAGTADLEVADMNRDGIPDLVARWAGTAHVLYNDGSAEFAPGPMTPMDPMFRIADVDLDSYMDLIGLSPGFLRVSRSSGGGTFEAAFNGGFPMLDLSPRLAFVHDFNSDGKPDVLMGNVVVLNESDVSTATIVQDVTLAREDGRVHLAWRVEDGGELLGFEVMRAPALRGPYVSITSRPLISRAHMSVYDDDVRVEQDYWYRIVALVSVGERIVVWTGMAPRLEGAASLRAGLFVYQAPSGEIDIRYISPSTAHRTHLTLFDVRGRLVRSHAREACGRCVTTLRWDPVDARGTPLGRGVYFMHLNTGASTLSRRLLLLHR